MCFLFFNTSPKSQSGSGHDHQSTARSIDELYAMDYSTLANPYHKHNGNHELHLQAGNYGHNSANYKVQNAGLTRSSMEKQRAWAVLSRNLPSNYSSNDPATSFFSNSNSDFGLMRHYAYPDHASADHLHRHGAHDCMRRATTPHGLRLNNNNMIKAR